MKLSTKPKTANLKKARIKMADIVGKCPHCGADMATGFYGICCIGSCGFRIRKVLGVELDDLQKIALLDGEEILVEGIISRKTGKPYDLYVKSKGIREYTFTKRDGTEGTGYDFDLERRFPEREK